MGRRYKIGILFVIFRFYIKRAIDAFYGRERVNFKLVKVIYEFGSFNVSFKENFIKGAFCDGQTQGSACEIIKALSNSDGTTLFFSKFSKAGFENLEKNKVVPSLLLKALMISQALPWV